jgi:hypothetical protein
MDHPSSIRSTVLLACSITIAVFFTTFILLDSLRIDHVLLGVFRELLMIPFFIGMVVLPVVIIADVIRLKKMPPKLLIALILSILSLALVLIKTFVFYND